MHYYNNFIKLLLSCLRYIFCRPFGPVLPLHLPSPPVLLLLLP